MAQPLVRRAPPGLRVIGSFTLEVLKSSQLFVNSLWLHDHVHGDHGDFVLVPGYVLEGLSLLASHGAEGLAAHIISMPGGNVLGHCRLTLTQICSVLQWLEDKGAFKSKARLLEETGDNVDKLADASEPALCIQAAGLRSTEGVGDPSPPGCQQSLVFPFLMPDYKNSLRKTGEMVLLCGPRFSSVVRFDAVGSYRTICETIMETIQGLHGHANTAARQSRLVHTELGRISTPRVVVLMAACPFQEYETLSERLLYARSDKGERESWIRRNLIRIIHRFPTLHKISKRLGPLEDPISSFRSICTHRLKSRERVAEEVLIALEAELGTAEGKKHVTFLCKRYEGAILISKLEEARSSAVFDASKGDGNRGVEQETDKLFKGKLVLAADAQRLLLESSAYNKAYVAFQDLYGAGQLTETVVVKLFSLICRPGLLICWQLLLRHSQLRSLHPFLNLVTKLKPHLLATLGYCLVVGPKLKRQGFAENYTFPLDQHEIWISGNHRRLALYSKGYLASEVAIQGATGVADGIDEADWVYNGDHFSGMKNYYHRLTMGYGYANKPEMGFTARYFFAQLGKYRSLVLKAPVDERPAMYTQMLAWYHQFQDEGGAYLVELLDEISPVDKRLEGYLPPRSKTSGVIKALTRALRAQAKIDNFRKSAPALFADRQLVIQGGRTMAEGTSLSGTKREREGEEDALKDPKALKVGRLKSKVKVLSSEYHCIGDTVYGPHSELAAKCNVAVDARCWPVMTSTKPVGLRAEVCPCSSVDGHGTAKTRMHKPVNLPKGWKSWYTRPKEGFQLPTSSEGAASAVIQAE